MNTFRTIIFWLHLACGVTAGAIVLLMSVTGVLLTYEMQLQQWEAGGSVEKPASGTALPIEALIAASGRTEPPASITLSSDPGRAVTISWGRDATIMVDPYTAEILPEAPRGVREGLSTLRTWHRWVGQTGDNRAFGKSITGVCNMAFLFIVVSGLYLWFPRKLSWSNFRSVLWFRKGLASKARDFNWHNVIGVWSMVPLFFIVFSGAVISYPWVSDLVYQAFGEDPPVRSRGPKAEEPQAPPPGIDELSLTAYGAAAAEVVPAWRTIRIDLPKTGDASVQVRVDAGSGRQPQKQTTLSLDAKTAEVVKVQRFSDYTPGYQARRLLRFAHTGEVAGVVGQTIAALVSLGACFLVWTGIALSWRRWRAWMTRRADA